MEVIIQPMLKSIKDLQRLYVSRNIAGHNCGKYALAKLDNKEIYLCRIFIDDIDPAYCKMNPWVFCHKHKKEKPTCGYPSLIGLEIIPRINYIKTALITIVFKEPEDVLKWRVKQEALISSIKDIMRLFVVCCDCTISLEDFNFSKAFSINQILVHSIGNVLAGKIVETSKVKIHSTISSYTYQQKETTDLQELTGLSESSAALNDLFMYQIAGPRLHGFLANKISSQIILIGPAGSGKTTLVKRVAQKNEVVLLSYDAAQFCGFQRTGGSFKEIFYKGTVLAKETGKCILLIKHVDYICKKPGQLLNDFLLFLDSSITFGGLIVIGTTDSPSLLHPSVRRPGRLHNEVFVTVPTEPERADILTSMLRNLRIRDRNLLDIAKSTPGFVMADLVILARNIIWQLHKFPVQEDISDEEIATVICKSLQSVEASSLKGEIGLVQNKRESNEIGGLQSVKIGLEQAVVWPLVHSIAFKRLGISQPSGILLYGPPGCAKTSLVRALANEVKVTFLSVTAADLYSSYVGETEHIISNLFQKARAAAPSILFIDEIDAIVGSREGKERGSHERVLSSFLTEMDGVGLKFDLANHSESNIVVIAATNRPDSLDSALLRPGRFDRLIYVPPPDAEDRLDILEKITKKMPLSDCVNLKAIADKTDLFSGADLENLGREAALYALTQDGIDCTKIKQQHWLNALSEMKPSLSVEQVNKLKQAFSS